MGGMLCGSIAAVQLCAQALAQTASPHLPSDSTDPSNSPPRIVRHPISQTVTEGTTAQFSAAAESTLPWVSIEWYHNDQLIRPPVASYVYTLPDVTPANAGAYYLVACNSAGCATTQVAQLTVTTPGPLDHWQTVWPTSPTALFGPVAYGNGSYVVAAADAGDAQILLSKDGTSWCDTDAGFCSYYQKLLFVNGHFFLAGGEDHGPALILTSTNGSDWDIAFQASDADLFHDLAWSDGRFLALAREEDGPERMFVSTNGLDWAEHNPGTTRGLGWIAASQGQWLGIQAADASGHLISLSPNGLTWTNVGTLKKDYLLGLTTAADKFFAYGIYWLAWTTNGSTWFDVDLPNLPMDLAVLRSLAYGPRGFVGLATGFCDPTLCFSPDVYLLRSPDAITWTADPFPVSTELYAVTFCGDLYVATGDQGVIFTSADGLAWTQRTGSSTRHVRGLAGQSRGAVAVGRRGLILTAQDGQKWQRLDGITQEDLNAIVYHKTRYVAVGGTASSFIATSTNGVDWATWRSPDGSPLLAVAAKGPMALAVGLHGTVVQSDHDSWALTIVAGTPDFRAVAPGEDLFVAIARPDPVGYPPSATPSVILTSEDGLSWIPQLTNTLPINRLAAGADLFVAVGQTGHALISPDGFQWQPVTLGINDLTDLIFAKGLFVATGRGGELYSSTNGLDWVAHDFRPQAFNLPSPTAGCWIGFGLDSFFAGSIYERIGQSESLFPRLRNPALIREPLELQGQLGGWPGLAFQLQATTNLLSWTDLGLFTNSPALMLSFPIRPTEPKKFYRILPP